jgi:hypothetical protein
MTFSRALDHQSDRPVDSHSEFRIVISLARYFFSLPCNLVFLSHEVTQ